MSTTALPMYTKEAPSSLGKLLLSTVVRKAQEGDITVQIHEHCIMESSSKGKLYLPYDFDLKFGYLANPPSVYFEKESAKVTYEVKSGA